MFDISFNRLTKIENLDALVNLEKLFLCSNKITVIENLSSLTGLTMLELGDNKIRVSFSIYKFSAMIQSHFLGNQRSRFSYKPQATILGKKQNYKNPELGQVNKPRVPELAAQSFNKNRESR